MGTRIALAAAALIWGGVQLSPALARDANASAAASPELARTSACIVGIALPRPDKGQDLVQVLGSGFVVDADEGLVLTAAHLLKGHDAVSVVDAVADARSATTLSADDKTDVALLRVAGRMQCALAFASDEPTAGQAVFAFPYRVPEPSAPHGTIAEIQDRFLKFDFPLEFGASGAPVVDDQGRVVGMAVAIVGKSATKPVPGFGIRLRDLRSTLAAMRPKD